jgi:signal transduction histidine kinase
MESILLNLLSNALKYKHPERQPHVKFITRNTNGSVILEVSDNGLGINLDRYGHQVFKLRKTFHQHPDGRGIGLFMIKNQIEAMGGKIKVNSVEGEGSTFVITF